jgi:hypothetical protein
MTDAVQDSNWAPELGLMGTSTGISTHQTRARKERLTTRRVTTEEAANNGC